MTLESLMPAKCWMAPETPKAIYNSGATIFPVWPTWQAKQFIYYQQNTNLQKSPIICSIKSASRDTSDPHSNANEEVIMIAWGG